MNEVAGAAVRHPVWRGVQEVDGLWWSAEVLSAEARLARMLAVWHPGCRAYRFDHGDALCFARPQTLRCEEAVGLPLCRRQGALYSAPLTAAELASRSGIDIGLVAGAEVLELRFGQGIALDPSEAIGLDDYALHEAYDCSAAPPALEVARLEGRNVRGVLGDAAPPRSEQSEDFLRAMAAKRPARRRRGPVVEDVIAVGEGLRATVHGLLSWLLPGPGGHRSGSEVPARRTGGRPSAWRDRLARLAAVSRLGRLIGYRHGAYLRRMMSMFERGDLDEALRNALPLGGLGPSLGQAFGVPGRRASLGLSTNAGARASLNLGGELEDHLRRMYRKAFAELDRKGRVDEAVFVLAELLDARQEALDYLVRHERHAQAAELALGWDMPSAMIIRLLLLAGDKHRAIQVARRDGAFAEAVQQLQGSHPALAAQLREEWGLALVEGGHWLEAVNAIWPLAEKRGLATQWLLAAERAGEALSARALVQRASLLPDTLPQYAARIEALADPGADPAPRAALADALLAIKGHGAGPSRLAACVLPAVAADCSAGRNGLGCNELNRLMTLADDACLKADMPRWGVAQAGEPAPFWNLDAALPLALPDSGVDRIHDAAVLPDRHYLVALGEGGAIVVDARGRVRQRYAVPAYRLVLAASGQVALAVAPREHVSRIARLDLVTRAITDLGVMPLQFAAPTFCGSGWTVVVDNQILVLDIGKGLNDVMWRVGDLPGPVLAAGFFADCEVFLVRNGDTLQDWTYSLPQRRLRGRDDIALDEQLPVVAHRQDAMQQPHLNVRDDETVEFVYREGTRQRASVLEGVRPDEVQDESFFPLEQGMLVGVHQEDRSRYFVIGFSNAACVATLEAPPGVPLGVREQPGHVLLHAADGRLLDIDTRVSVAHALSLL